MESKQINCNGCSKKLSIFKFSRRCYLCSNYYIDYKFCSSCCIRANYKFSDRLLMRKFCFPCYSLIEFSRLDQNLFLSQHTDNQIETPGYPTEEHVYIT